LKQNWHKEKARSNGSVMSMKEQKRLRKIKQAHEGRLLRQRGVVGVGIGNKVVGGEVTDESCIRVYVRKKLPEDVLKEHSIPARIKGIPTDVIELNLRTMAGTMTTTTSTLCRPLAGGCSLGSLLYDEVGTLGLVVRSEIDEDSLFGLTCYHVMCPTDHFIEGDPISQPGLGDGGDSSSLMGEAYDCALRDHIDVGLVRLTAASEVGKLSDGTIVSRIGSKLRGTVTKLGKTSGSTVGQIVDSNLTFIVQYDFGLRYEHHHLLLVRSQTDEPFMRPGDSGAALLNEDSELVGLMIGGDEDKRFGVACPIAPIFDLFSVTL
jgi:hypothetical protein